MTTRVFNFLRFRNYALAFSLAVILAGAVTIGTRGPRLGVEFTGGTAVILEFEQPPSLETIRPVLAQAFGSDVVLHDYGPRDAHQVMIRVPAGPPEGGEHADTGAADALEQALRAAGVAPFRNAGSEYIGPAIGDELRTNGLSAMTLSLGGILAYLTVRYRFSFAVGAIVATIHDLLVTVACLAIFDYDLTLNVVAGLLTVAGYSSNDTIVVFDRVRERLGRQKLPSLTEVLNVAISQTLSRTIITAGTTLLAVLGLFLFGGDALRGLAFTLIVGIVSGTYSTVFIAGGVVEAGAAWRASRAKSQQGEA